MPTAAVANDLGERAQIVIGDWAYLFANRQPAMRVSPQRGYNPEAIYVSPSEHLSMRDYDYFSRVFMNDWRGGAGQIAYVVEDPLSKRRFYDSTGMVVSDAGRFSCARNITANTNGTSANTTALPLQEAGGLLYMGESSAVEYSAAWSSAPSSAATSSAGNVTALTTDGQYVYGAVAGVGIYRWTINSTSAGTLWNSNSTDYHHLLWVNRTVYALRDAAFYSFNSSGTRTTLFTPPTGWTLQDIQGRRGGSIDSPILILGTRGDRSYLWQWDGVTIHDYLALPSGFVGSHLLVYLGVTYVYGYRLQPDAGASPCAFYIVNDTLGFLGYFGVEQSDGDPTAAGSTEHDAYALDAYDNFVYFGVYSATGMEVWTYDITTGAITRQVRITSSTSDQIQSLKVYRGGPWVTLLGSGLYQTRQTFVTTATLDTSDMHLGQPWASNLWANLEVTHKALAVGESVAVSYSSDQGATYTALVTNDTDDSPRTTAILSTASTSVKNPYLRLRFTLTSGTSQATTPYVFSFALKAAPVDPAGIVIEAYLACPDVQLQPNGAPDFQGGSGSERLYNIKDLYESGNVVNVIYLAPSSTRAKNPTTVACKVIDYDLDFGPNTTVRSGKGIEGTARVLLRQVL